MNITRFSIQRPVGITMIVMFFVVLGLYCFHRIGVELLPALNTPIVTVSVHYGGAGAEEMEQQIIKPLENALSSVSNLKKMTAVAKPESCTIILEYDFTANADTASIEATKKVDSVRRKLPDGADDPVVIKRDANSSPILEVAITSPHSLADTYQEANDVFVEQLQRSPGVSDISISGGRQKEVAVEADRDKLFFYGISLNQLVSKIAGENGNVPSGTLYTDQSEKDVRLLGEFSDPLQIKDLQISTASGAVIPLREFIDVKQQNKRVDRISRVNGQEGVSLHIYKNSDANLVDAANGVKAKLEELKANYPDYQFVTVTDESVFVDRSLHNTLGNLIEGIFTTGLVLYLFLRGWRSSIMVLVAIPTSLISTFLGMYIAGFTFNMMSLMGMALCIGILVDDSVVVLENIHRHLAMGKNAAQAAEEGRTEIGMAALAITLCDVVVFLPIAFMNGMTGQFFRQFGLTIVFATLFSLFISFTLTPMLASRFYKNGFREAQGPFWDKTKRFESQLIASYEKFLYACLRHPKKVLAGVLAALVITGSLVPLKVIGWEYMPKTDEGSFKVNVELPTGKGIEETDKITSQLEQSLLKLPEVTYVLNQTGNPSSNMATLSVSLVPQKERDRSVWQITDEVRKMAKSLPQAQIRVSETQSSVAGVSSVSGGSGPMNGGVQIELRSQDNDKLLAASKQVIEQMSQIPGMKDIRSTYQEGMPESQLMVDWEKLRFYNVAAADVGKALQAAVSGQQAGVYRKSDGEEININVRLKGSEYFRSSDLKQIPITSNGMTVLLGQVTKMEDGTGPVSIRRVDKQRTITLVANTDKPLEQALREVKAQIDQMNLGDGISYRFIGQAESMNDTFREMALALGLSLVLIYMLLAILYESFLTPLIRMCSLPLGLIGSLAFLALTHQTLNLYSLIGILVMDGLVAKNGTLLLDYALTLMHQGKPPLEAIVESGKTRLRPIVMTTITMIVGMLPTALAMTEGAETRVSMAWVLIGGLLSSTFFTLIVIPLLFLYLPSHGSWQNEQKAL